MAKPRVTIVGLGRLGGSIGLGLKRAKSELEIVGHDKNASTAAQALKRGAVDKTDWNLINACESASLIVLALPLNAIAPTLSALGKYLQPGQILTDTAATKVPVMEAAKLLPDSISYIGGDPILAANRKGEPGGEGIAAADAGLFQDALYCLTPAPTAGDTAIQTLMGMVSMLGAKPFFLDADEHDSLVTGVRHLALVYATALLKTAAESPSWRDMSKLAGADFYRATEPLAGDPGALAETLLANREALLHWMDSSAQALEELRELLLKNDAAALTARLDKLGTARERWLHGDAENIAEAGAPNFSEVSLNPLRLFVGGLANRMPKSPGR